LQDLGLGADCFISLVIGHSSLLSLWQENDIRENGQMITSIVFDVDDTIYDQQAPYRIAMEKCFPDFDMSHMNQAYIRFRHYSDVGFPRVMAGEWTTEYFRFWRCKETLLEFGYHEIDEEMGNHFQEVYEHELENITMLDEMRMTLDFLKEKNVRMGIIWGKICIDTIKETVYLSNIQREALPIIETAVTEYMMKEKSKLKEQEHM